MLSERTFVIRDKAIWEKFLSHAGKLDFPFQCVLGPVRTPRNLEQNARLWALHGLAAEQTGYTKDELHEMMLCESTGYEEITLGKQIRRRPLKRSSTMSKREFAEFLSFVDDYYARELGVWLEQESYGGTI